MKHSALIAAIVEACGYQSYLELGVHKGETISRVKCKRRVGVDIVPCVGDWDHRTMTTMDFFSLNEECFDVVFIDAAHDVESVYCDYMQSVNVVKRGGVILIHDIDPDSEEMTVPNKCGEAWRFRHMLQNQRITLPVGREGLMLVRPDRWRYGS